MPVKCPSMSLFKALGRGLSDVVQYRGPTQPEVVGMLRNIIDHLQGMIEIVFMPLAINVLGPGKLDHLRKDDLQQPAFVQEIKSHRWFLTQQDFIQLIGNPFTAYNGYPFCAFGDGLPGFLFDTETKLAGKTDRTHHAQGIIAESLCRRQRGLDDLPAEVGDAIKGIDECSVIRFVQADGEGVDGKIAAVLIIFQGTAFHRGFTAVETITLFAGAYEFDLDILEFDLCRSKVPEEMHLGPRVEFLCRLFGQRDPVAHTYNINILGGALQYFIPYETADQVTGYSQFFRGVGDLFEDEQFLIGTINIHAVQK